jgi:hypothetical protein
VCESTAKFLSGPLPSHWGFPKPLNFNFARASLTQFAAQDSVVQRILDASAEGLTKELHQHFENAFPRLAQSAIRRKR